jgi:predicted NAD-dependent protein-ADP-ribosyltransferase YbiA (DUF1768 family)
MNNHSLIENWNETLHSAEHRIVRIGKVEETEGWMGNMSPFPVRVDGLRYPTTEHLFQAMRFEDQHVREQIRAAKSPMAAKMLARKLMPKKGQPGAALRVEPRSALDLDLMRTVLRIKLAFYPSRREDLCAQKSDWVVIEDCSNRAGKSAEFWGMRLKGDQWTGQNWLGRLWMELRNELQGTRVTTLDLEQFPGSLLKSVREKLSPELKKAA